MFIQINIKNPPIRNTNIAGKTIIIIQKIINDTGKNFILFYLLLNLFYISSKFL